MRNRTLAGLGVMVVVLVALLGMSGVAQASVLPARSTVSAVLPAPEVGHPMLVTTRPTVTLVFRTTGVAQARLMPTRPTVTQSSVGPIYMCPQGTHMVWFLGWPFCVDD